MPAKSRNEREMEGLDGSYMDRRGPCMSEIGADDRIGRGRAGTARPRHTDDGAAIHIWASRYCEEYLNSQSKAGVSTRPIGDNPPENAAPPIA